MIEASSSTELVPDQQPAPEQTPQPSQPEAPDTPSDLSAIIDNIKASSATVAAKMVLKAKPEAPMPELTPEKAAATLKSLATKFHANPAFQAVDWQSIEADLTKNPNTLRAIAAAEAAGHEMTILTISNNSLVVGTSNSQPPTSTYIEKQYPDGASTQRDYEAYSARFTGASIKAAAASGLQIMSLEQWQNFLAQNPKTVEDCYTLLIDQSEKPQKPSISQLVDKLPLYGRQTSTGPQIERGVFHRRHPHKEIGWRGVIKIPRTQGKTELE